MWAEVEWFEAFLQDCFFLEAHGLPRLDLERIERCLHVTISIKAVGPPTPSAVLILSGGIRGHTVRSLISLVVSTPLDWLATGRIIYQSVIMWIALMMVRSCRLGVELAVRQVASGGGLTVPLDNWRQHLVHSVASRHTVLHVTLIRDPWQLGQSAVVASSHFTTPMMLRSVYVMYVPSILVAATPTPRACLILVDLPSIVALCI